MRHRNLPGTGKVGGVVFTVLNFVASFVPLTGRIGIYLPEYGFYRARIVSSRNAEPVDVQKSLSSNSYFTV
jgi:hypothetical protein